MDLRIVSLFLTAFIIGVVGFLIYIRRLRDIINISFGLFVISVAVWSLGVAVFYLSPFTTAALFWSKFLYFAGGVIPSLFYYFALVFPTKKIPRILSKLLIFTPNILLFYIYFFTDFILKDIEVINGVKHFIYGPGHIIFDLHFDAFFLLAFINLAVSHYRESVVSTKNQLRFIIMGTLLGLILAGITNVVLPWFNDFRFIWLGPPLTIIWVFFIAYAIAKHHLLNVKVIATEVFTLAIMFLLFANIFAAQSARFRNIYITIFLAVSFLGYLIIKSVLREVRQREEIQRLATSLEDANKRLVKLDKEKSEFLSIATHQLRTPMTVVKGYISMILEGAFGAFSDKAKEAIAKVYTSNERLIKLIDDLLNISRIERGKMDYDFQVLPLEKLVGDVILELKPVAERKGLKINWQEPVGLPKIKFDESKMRQVVLNLIDNAVKYTEKGEIDAKLEKINGKIRLTIKDTGAGLAKEKIPLLFKKYSRVETKSPYGKHTQGMGLGLYVAKRIIDDHKGKIWAESEGEGKGSAFFVELPAD